MYENHTMILCRSLNELYDYRFSVIDYGSHFNNNPPVIPSEADAGGKERNLQDFVWNTL